MRSILLGACALALGACANEEQPAPEPFGCPLELETDETSGGQPVSYQFRYVSFFDGDPADMANLAPEEDDGEGLSQRWRFGGERVRAITMVCRYHGTDRTIEKVVPDAISECRLKGEVTETGEIAGSPELSCS